MLRRSFAIYVLNDFVTKKEIFKIRHNNIFLIYFARVRIENVIYKKYFWLNIWFKINEYIRIYFNCQRVRVYHHKLYNKFNFILSNDENLFYTIIINFIIDMLLTRNLYINKINDIILILINKLTKHAIYIAIIKNLNIKNFAKLLWRKFISHHDIMRDIILNKNSLFTNYFWSTLCWHLNIKCQFNIAFHSQINNQIEKYN